MKLDLTETIKAPFKQNWFLKSIGGGILLLIPILNIFILGFAIKYVKNVSNKNNIIPSITDSTFLIGVKYSLGSLLLTLPLLLLNAFGAVTMLNQQANGGGAATIISGISALAGLAIAILTPALTMNFSNTEKVSSMIDFNAGIEIIKRDIGSYASMFVYVILICIIYGIIETICFITIVGIILLPSIIFLQTISIMNLWGQYFAITKNIN